MRRPLALALALLSLLLVAGVTSCSSDEGSTTLTQQTLDTTPATDGLDTTDGTEPLDDGTTPATDATAPGSATTKVPRTFPKRTTTTRPKTTPTTRPRVTTTTRPRATSTSRPPVTVDPNKAAFCAYAAGLNLAALGEGSFVDSFDTLYNAAVDGIIVAPAVLVPYLNDVKAVLDQLKPLVDSGQVATAEEAAAWFLTQPTEEQDKLRKGLDTVKLWYAAECR